MIEGATTKFASLEPVDIKQCWPDEARDFTPWLASHEGIKLLAQALRTELSVEGTEVAVGPYAADIVARDLTSNELVVIENQLEKTDHRHLGQLLTYASVLDASTVVWVARQFTDEHLKAIEWLNERTKGALLLYGVEIQAWKISGSLPAPRLEVVMAPNAVVTDTDPDFTDTKRQQLEFWTAVRDALAKSGKFPSLQTPRPRSWFDIALGRANIYLQLVANTWDKFVGVRVYVGSKVADAALPQLLPMKEAIEKDIGAVLEWNPFPEKMDKVIRLVRAGDISQKAQWPELIGWLTTHAVAFKQAFAPRIAALSLSTASPNEAPEHE